MKRIKYLGCLSGTDWFVNRGDVAEVTDADAARLAERGMAEIIEDLSADPITEQAAEPAGEAGAELAKGGADVKTPRRRKPGE